MQKQKKQFIILIVILLLAVGGYFATTHISEKEASESEDNTENYSLISMDSTSVSKLSFTNESGTYTFHKDGEDWISDDDASLDIEETTIDSMVAELSSLSSTDQIENVEDVSEFGLDAPIKKLLISDGDNTVTVLVGAENSSISKYYACLESDQNTVYTLDVSSVTTFDKTLEDCIAEPETTEADTAETEETESVEIEDTTSEVEITTSQE